MGKSLMNHWQLHQAVRALRQGGVIAYPTETVYGLGCDPLDGQAVQRLLAIKQRDIAKGLILIGADIAHLLPYCAELDRAVLAKLRSRPKHPVTWLVPAHADVPYWIRGRHTSLAARVTTHPLAARLCELFGGAIISTSANLAGRPPARNVLDVRRQLGDNPDSILCGTAGPFRQPSEIRDAVTGHIVRAAR